LENESQPKINNNNINGDKRKANYQSNKLSSDSNNYKRNSYNNPNFKNKQSNYNSNILISVVIPLLNEEESLQELSLALESQLNNIAQNRWEVIFIDDGSTDNSYNVIKTINERNKKFKAIRFRRNYGKSAALSVGFKEAKGKVVITMDADLQDDPKEIPNLIAKLKEGYDLVSGWKKIRHDPFNKTFPSKLFNKITAKASGLKLHDFNCGLKAYRREVVKSLQVYGEMHRYLPALAHWDGYKCTEIPVEHHSRVYGESKYPGLSRGFKGLLDLSTIVFTHKYLKRPLHFFGAIGISMFVIGVIIDLWLVIEKLFCNTTLSERPLLFLGIALIIVGVQLFSIGLLGEMLVKNTIDNSNYNIKERLY